MGWFAEAFGPWYGVVYPHRDDAEARRLASTLAAWRDLAGRRHLDVGAGAARHLDALAELGVRSVGLDYSEHLLAEARRRAAPGAPWRLVRGDMRHLPFG
ncbi:MAG: class I SAM-dependent methyltransferase, partial [Gemmatimonadetes bacterium]|nr:class I SAM-dependent methyltransferase [Gemmatimonadota bacterium]